MLAIDQAMMAKLKVLLLDEPSMGLAPLLVREISDIIRVIKNEETTILLVEQNTSMAPSVASRAYVLQTGQAVIEGTAEDVARTSEVRQVYLGEH